MEERAPYVQDFQKACVIQQRKDALSKHLSEAQRVEYCECAATRSAETITLEEIGTMLRTQSRDSIKSHLDAVAKYCGEKLANKWKPR